jgi:hypothetical protein
MRWRYRACIPSRSVAATGTAKITYNIIVKVVSSPEGTGWGPGCSPAGTLCARDPRGQPATVSAPPYDRSALFATSVMLASRVGRESVSLMILYSMAAIGKTWQRAAGLGLVLVLLGGCGADRLSPTSENPTAGAAPGDSVATVPTDSTTSPTDSTIIPIDSTSGDTTGVTTLAGSLQPGVVFGNFNMDESLINSMYTGIMPGGAFGPTNALTMLSATKARGGRIVIKLCMGRDSYVKNPDGTFSLTKWKALVDRFKTINMGPYITDGTIIGHWLIDEPNRAARWGGKIIPQATLEAMAQYSKQLWPSMTTFVRVAPSWLATSTITYNYLDAAWLQYASYKTDVTTLVAAEVAAAKKKGLGLMMGMNVLNGGNGSSKIPGLTSGMYAMSATELRTYGTVLLNQSYACGFFNWTYDGTYFGRSDIKSAMTDLSTIAKAHVKTSCRQ